MALFSMFAGIFIIIAFILGAVFFTGFVLTSSGIIANIVTKRKGMKKTYPKVLIIIGSVIMAIVAVIFILTFAAGASKISQKLEDSPNMFRNDSSIFVEVSESFIEAVGNHNAQAIYDMFSQTTKNENSNLMRQIEKFLDEYPDNTDSLEIDRLTGGGSSWTDGKKENHISGHYEFYKDEIRYVCSISYISVDEVNPDNEGIENIWLYADGIIGNDRSRYPQTDGIYAFLESDTSIFVKVSESFIEAVENNNAQAIYDMFSQTTKSENSNFMEQIEKFLDEYPDNTDSLEINKRPKGRTDWTDSKEKNHISGYYEFYKDGVRYVCSISYISADEINPDNEGIEDILLVTDDVRSSYSFEYPPKDGIYAFVRIEE